MAEQGDAARVHRCSKHHLAGTGPVHQQPEQRDDDAAHHRGEDLVLWGAHAHDVDDALDDRKHGLGVVGEEVGDQLLDHDSPEQRAGEHEDFLFLVRDAARFLDRLHHHEVGREGHDQRDENSDQRAGIAIGIQHAGRGPRGNRRCHHDGAVGQVQHAGHTEDQCKAHGAQRVQRADRKAVDENLKSKH